MRIAFTTLQFGESDFYARVGRELEAMGHSASHLVVSRRAAAKLGDSGHRVLCLPELIEGLGAVDVEAEVERIEARYPIPSLRDVYRTDPACAGKPERWSVERTVRHFLALEQAFDEVDPEAVVPEVGSETMRTVAHLVGRERGATVAFLFYTIFPRPLRLYLDEYHGPIVPREGLRELTPPEREEIEGFIADFNAAAQPVLKHRKSRVTPAKLRDFARHLVVRATYDRDNEYLRPHRFVLNYFKQRGRALLTRRLYERLDPSRPFVYFPLHVTDDFKIKRTIPHCVDQASLIEQVADALPQGHDLVLKEHPWSLGKNELHMLRRLISRDNVKLVDAYTSSHELIQRSCAVAVIGSTVGLEALLYAKPVLTLGQPFYSGYGVTVDVDSFREIRDAVPAALAFEPDRELILRFLGAAMRSTYPGAPGSVDPSEQNARTLAASLDAALRKEAPDRSPAPVPTPA